MAVLKILGQTKTDKVKRSVKATLGVDILIYDQKGFSAPDNATIGSIRSKRPEQVEVRVVGQTLVKNIKDFFSKNYGIQIEILDGHGEKAAGDATLGSVKRSYGDREDEPVSHLDEAKDATPPIEPATGLLVKLSFMVVDAISEEIEELDEPISIETGTLGGKLLELFVILESDSDSFPDGRLTLASRILQRTPMLEEDDVILKPIQYIQEPNEEGVEFDNGKVSEGWPNRLFENLDSLWELQRPSTDDEFYEYLDALIDIINDEGIYEPGKLYNLIGSPWNAFETSAAPRESLAASTNLELLKNTLVVNYTPTFEEETYQPNQEQQGTPFITREGEMPEWHDEVDTIFIFEGYDLIDD